MATRRTAPELPSLANAAWLKDERLLSWRFDGSHIRPERRVQRLPYAVLIDEQGTLRAKGLINTREHLDSLFTARELGFDGVAAALTAAVYVPVGRPLSSFTSASGCLVLAPKHVA